MAHFEHPSWSVPLMGPPLLNMNWGHQEISGNNSHWLQRLGNQGRWVWEHLFWSALGSLHVVASVSIQNDNWQFAGQFDLEFVRLDG